MSLNLVCQTQHEWVPQRAKWTSIALGKCTSFVRDPILHHPQPAPHSTGWLRLTAHSVQSSSQMATWHLTPILPQCVPPLWTPQLHAHPQNHYQLDHASDLCPPLHSSNPALMGAHDTLWPQSCNGCTQALHTHPCLTCQMSCLRYSLSVPPLKSHMAHMTCPYSIQIHPIHREVGIATIVAIMHTHPTNSHFKGNVHQHTLWIHTYTPLLCWNHLFMFLKWSDTHSELGQPNQLSKCLHRWKWPHPHIPHHCQIRLLCSQHLLFTLVHTFNVIVDN